MVVVVIWWIRVGSGEVFFEEVLGSDNSVPGCWFYFLMNMFYHDMLTLIDPNPSPTVKGTQ